MSELSRGWAVGEPCPFLMDDACAAYEARPVACRTLLNLDDDALLCEHDEAGQADVPYADATAIRAMALAAEPSIELADVRDFFPQSLNAGEGNLEL